MSDSGKYQIEIFGNTYTIKGEGNERYVRELARHVDDRMVEISKSSPALALSRIAILSALNITDDYFQSRDKVEKLNATCEQLVDRINRILAQ